MAYSQVGVANLALIRIGEGAISSIDGTDATSISVKQVFDYILDEVLGEHPWNFAKKSFAMAQDVTAPVDTDYAYRYALPSDFIQAIEVKPTGVSYVIRAGYLLTNHDNTNNPLILNYTRRESNPALWSAKFINAFAFRLAAELAFRVVRGSSNVQDRMMNFYARALLQAKAANQAEDYLEDEKGASGTDSWVGAGRGILNYVDLTTEEN